MELLDSWQSDKAVAGLILCSRFLYLWGTEEREASKFFDWTTSGY